MSLRRAFASAKRRCSSAGWALATIALTSAALWVPLAVSVHSTAEFPRVAPAQLAHLLADFSNHPHLYPHLGSWSIEEEASNYTSWRYSVAYACGARCAGRALVTAHDSHEGVARHGPAHAHRVHVAHRSCSRLPLLAWPSVCDEWETETVVTHSGSGAHLEETAISRCGALRALAGGCTADLRAARADHLKRLRTLIQLRQ